MRSCTKRCTRAAKARRQPPRQTPAFHARADRARAKGIDWQTVERGLAGHVPHRGRGDLTQKPIHTEFYTVPQETVDAIPYAANGAAPRDCRGHHQRAQPRKRLGSVG